MPQIELATKVDLDGIRADLDDISYVYDVHAYGAQGDGIADDAPALRAAFAAAASGGEVVLRSGTYLMGSAVGGACALLWPANMAAKPRIRGASDGSTVIKLTSACKSFIGVNSYGAGVVYQNLELEDLTIDCDNVPAGSSQNFGVVIAIGGRCSIKRFAMRRVKTKNVGPLVNTGSERRNVDMTIFCNAYDDAAGPFEASDLVMEDCHFRGGNYGWLLSAFAQTQISTVKQAQATNGIANCWMDEIHCTRCTFDSEDSVDPDVTAYSSSGFMFGNHALGGKLRVTDCHVRNTNDDGFEVNSWYDAVLSGCTTENCPQEGFYFVNLGGMPEPEKQTIKVVNCRTSRDDTLGASVTGIGFGVRPKTGSPHGTLIFDNCESVGDNVQGRTGQTLNILTDFRRVVVRNFKFSNVRSLVTAAGSTFQNYPIRVGNVTGRGVLVLDGIHLDNGYAFDVDGKTAINAFLVGIQIDCASDLHLVIRDLDVNTMVRLVNGTPASFAIARQRAIELASRAHGTDALGVQHTYGTASEIDDYLYEAGAETDFTKTSTGLQVSTGPTAEKRMRAFFGASASSLPSWGPNTDACVWAKALTPASAVTDFKAGVMVKGTESPLTGHNRFSPLPNYIETYLTDDGTNSFLCVDKVVGGVRTSLLGAIVGGAGTVTAINTPTAHQSDRGIQLASRLSTAATVYVRGRIQGNVVTADYFTSAPSTTAVTGSPVATTSVTLSAADAVLFGDGQQGWPGSTFVAVDDTSRLQVLTLVRMHVIRGTIDGLRFPLNPVYSLKSFSGLHATLTSEQLRIPSLEVVNADFSRTAEPSKMTELEGFDATQKRGVRVTRTKWANPPKPAAVTVGASPFTYVNEDGYDEDAYVYAGTVSKVELSTDAGVTFGEIGTASPAQARLRPGDQLRVTHSAAPTMRKVPV